MLTVNKVTKNFYLSDNFSREFDTTIKNICKTNMQTNEPETSLTDCSTVRF
ncbi:hypothetical protein EZS27_024458 [termite gut metagenome]|uniref:Uncharacterized protein n=1 Tax=termite gut metagenome TaxID=433724 RepID=A0A5J4QXX4_9ZZZZ